MKIFLHNLNFKLCIGSEKWQQISSKKPIWLTVPIDYFWNGHAWSFFGIKFKFHSSRIFMPKSVYPGQYIFTVLLLSFFQNGPDPLFEQIGISFTQEYLNYAEINLWFWRKIFLTASHFSYYPFRKGHDPFSEQMLVPFTQWYFAIKLKAPVVLDNFLPLFCNYLPLKKDMTLSSLREKKLDLDALLIKVWMILDLAVVLRLFSHYVAIISLSKKACPFVYGHLPWMQCQISFVEFVPVIFLYSFKSTCLYNHSFTQVCFIARKCFSGRWCDPRAPLVKCAIAMQNIIKCLFSPLH